jgi:hypothetical protein
VSIGNEAPVIRVSNPSNGDYVSMKETLKLPRAIQKSIKMTENKKNNDQCSSKKLTIRKYQIRLGNL